MRDTTKVLLAIVVTAVLVGGGAAIGSGGKSGSAKQGSTSASPLRQGALRAGPRFGPRGEGPLHAHGSLSAAATYLGLTADELRTQLEAGKTLAQVAEAKGKTVQGLEDAIVAAAKSELDADVAAGRLTSDQATAMLERLKANVGDLVNRTLPARGGPGDRHGPGFGFHDGLDAAATYLGLTEDGLHTQLESGKTLAQVAQARGKSVQGLEDAIVADAKSHLDQAVTDGRLSSAQAAQILADLKSRVDDLVNGKLPARPDHAPFFGGRHHGPPMTITA
jgi:hypothetical protein